MRDPWGRVAWLSGLYSACVLLHPLLSSSKLFRGLIEIGYPSRGTFSPCQRVLGKASFLFYGRGEEGDALLKKFPVWSSLWGHPALSAQDGWSVQPEGD